MKHLLLLPALFFSMISALLADINFDADKKQCPVCKSSEHVIPIVYGKPGKELMEKAERGEVRLGGCVIDKNSPHHYCKKDEKEF